MDEAVIICRHNIRPVDSWLNRTQCWYGLFPELTAFLPRRANHCVQVGADLLVRVFLILYSGTQQSRRGPEKGRPVLVPGISLGKRVLAGQLGGVNRFLCAALHEFESFSAERPLNQKVNRPLLG